MNKDLESFLERSFGIEKADSNLSTDNYLEYIDQRLQARLEVMINHNVDALFQVLYRIDVHQKQVDDAFSLGEIKKVCERLSSLIISRQLKKLEYSKSYKGE